jgi:hypothetical protein
MKAALLAFAESSSVAWGSHPRPTLTNYGHALSTYWWVILAGMAVLSGQPHSVAAELDQREGRLIFRIAKGTSVFRAANGNAVPCQQPKCGHNKQAA